MTSPLSRTTSTLSSTDMEALFAKIHKDQAAQLELLRHTKRAMDRTLAAKDTLEPGTSSMASLSFEILSELLDEIVLDVVSETHREVKSMRSICPICKTKCRNYVVRAGVDIFGQNPQSNNSQMYDCVHCQRSFPSQRYAPHLEKCLGLAGRASSRVASRRMGAGERAGSGSPFTPVSYSDDREASDSDKDLMEKKRKKNSGSGNGYPTGSNGTGGSNGGGDYGTPSSSKSSSSATIKIKKPKTDSSDYTAKSQKSSLLAKASKQNSSTKLKGLGLQAPSSSGTSSSSSSLASASAPASAVARAPAPVGEISLGYFDDNLLLANGRSLHNGSHGGHGTGAGASNGSSNNISTPQKLSSSNPKRSSSGSSPSKRPPGSGSSGKNGLKKSATFSSHGADVFDTDFIDIDGDGDEDGMEILQTPKKKKS